VAVQPIKFAIRRLESALETGRILRYLVGAIVVMVFASAIAIRVFDHQDFPSLGLALWWSVTTVTTVGYGDVVPVQPVGRVVASILMITGFASLSLLTGIVASLLVAKRFETTPTAAFDKLDERLAEIERLLHRLAD
jgi:voltage-gated potassium channel